MVNKREKGFYHRSLFINLFVYGYPQWTHGQHLYTKVFLYTVSFKTFFTRLSELSWCCFYTDFGINTVFFLFTRISELTRLFSHGFLKLHVFPTRNVLKNLGVLISLQNSSNIFQVIIVVYFPENAFKNRETPR